MVARMQTSWIRRALILAMLAVSFSAGQASGAGCLSTDPMPTGGGHDHNDRAQHRFACGVSEVASLDLANIVPDPVYFGELDVAGNRAAITIAYPRGGFVLFDISDHPHPRILSRFNGPPCDTVVRDYDCAADVKLSPDGRYAFLAIQKSLATAPGRTDKPALPRETGVMSVDLTNPAAPRRVSFAPIGPRGTHMLAVHTIGGRDWLFAIHNKQGFYVFERKGPVLHRVADVSTTGAHDFYVYDDPVDHKTYLYLAGETAGMFIYDVTDPTHPHRVGAWKPVSELADQLWYVHSVWTWRDSGRRYTLVDPELSAPGRDHGSLPAPIWLLDTTDLTAIRVVGEWRNPGKHPAGNSRFSTHDFTVVDGVSWLAHYHGGVWLLDWRPVIRGQATRPTEIGYFVPHSTDRPSVEVNPQQRFLSAFDVALRPSVWDVVTDGRFGFVSDISGGLVVIERAVTPPVKGKDSKTWIIAIAIALLLAITWISRRRALARRSLPESS